MTSKPKFKGAAFEAVYSAAQGLHRAGTLDKGDQARFRRVLPWAPVETAPEEVKRIRDGTHVSQTVFARFLNTSESTVQKWEAGTKRPSGMALKLLAIVEKHGLKVLAGASDQYADSTHLHPVHRHRLFRCPDT